MIGVGRSEASFGGAGSPFYNPYRDVASLFCPNTLPELQDFFVQVYQGTGSYASAMKRILGFFLTSIDISQVSSDERSKWNDYFDKQLKLLEVISLCCEDMFATGEGFVSFVEPFSRWLKCPGKGCSYEVAFSQIHSHGHFDFKWVMPDFLATCPSCKTRGPWIVNDRKGDMEKLTLRRWGHREIAVEENVWTKERRYFWRIPAEVRRTVRNPQSWFALEGIPKDVLQAVADNKDFLFAEGVIFHMRNQSMASRDMAGRGLPPMLAHFRAMFLSQVLHKQTEALGIDFTVPIRSISPAPRPGAGAAGGGVTQDAGTMTSGKDFRSFWLKTVADRRRDPAGFSISPFPVEYQVFGADANQFIPKDQMEYIDSQVLNDANVPVDLFNGSLQINSSAVSLRLLASTWRWLIHQIDAMIGWTVDRTVRTRGWEAVDAKLKPVTIADDIQKVMMVGQMAAAGDVSKTDFLRMVDLDYRDQRKQVAEEQRYAAEVDARNQEEMQQAGFAQQLAKGSGGAAGQLQAQMGGGGGPGGAGSTGPPGGVPSDGGGGGEAGAEGGPPAGPVSSMLSSGAAGTQSLQELEQTAESLSDQLLSMPEGQKDSELRKLGKYNSLLHSHVLKLMDKKRQGRRQQAVQQAGVA